MISQFWKKYSITVSIIMLIQVVLLLLKSFKDFKVMSFFVDNLNFVYDLLAFAIFYFFFFFLVHIVIMFFTGIWYLLTKNIGLGLLCLIASLGYVYFAIQIKGEW